MTHPDSVEATRKEFGLLFGAVLNYDQNLMESIWDWNQQQVEEAYRRGYTQGKFDSEMDKLTPNHQD